MSFVFSTSAIDFLEIVVSEMTHFESSGTSNSARSFSLSLVRLCTSLTYWSFYDAFK